MSTVAANGTLLLELETCARRFAGNVSFGWLTKIVQALAGIFLVGYLVRGLGTEQFGLVILATSTAAFLGLIHLGASGGIAKHLTMLRARGKSGLYAEYLNASVWLSLAMAGVMSVILGALLTACWPFPNVPDGLELEGRRVLLYIAAGAVCSSFSLPAVAALQAAHRMDVSERIKLGGVLIRVALVVVLFELSEALPVYYALALLLEQVMVTGGVWLALRRQPYGLIRFPGLPTRKVMGRIVALNALNLIVSLNYVLFMQAPVVILQTVGGLSASGLYGVGLQLNNALRGFLGIAMTAMSPNAVALHSTSRHGALKDLFHMSTKGFMCVGGLLWVWFYFFGDTLLLLWLHRDTGSLGRALPWILGAGALGVGAMPAAVVALALGRLRFSAMAGLCLVGIMVLSMVVGGSAAAADPLPRLAAMLAVFFGVYQFLRVVEVAWALGLRAGELARLTIRSLAPAAAAALVIKFILPGIPEGPIAPLALGTAAMGCLGAWTAWAVLFSSRERRLLRRALDSLLRPAAHRSSEPSPST